MDLVTVQKQFSQEIQTVKSLKDLVAVEIKYLGKKGVINSLLKEIKDKTPQERKSFGREVNGLKTTIIQLLDEKRKQILQEVDIEPSINISLPGKIYPKGSLHMLTLAIEEVSQIFEKLGFIRVSYPEVEWEYFAFEALNMPKNHPARDDFETFFVDTTPSKKYGQMILSPHTSSGQVREMLRLKKPPIRMINIAKCYRLNWDITHTPMFYQFEGLCVDHGINITHLKGTIDYFAKKFFGKDRRIRLRPHHFQFTEPSFEVDVSCGVCAGAGEINGVRCRVCKSGWLELAGAGMVHPNVLRAGGINPEIYTGWAFGFGPDRCAMMKEGLKLPDARILYSGDIRFLEQF